MADKSKLNDMVDKLINQNPEEAQIDFHDYLKSKLSDTLNASTETENENKMDKEE